MHSRIFQIEKEVVPEEERIDSDCIPEWFTNSVADYTSDDCSREDDIDWLMRSVILPQSMGTSWLSPLMFADTSKKSTKLLSRQQKNFLELLLKILFPVTPLIRFSSI